MAATKHSLSDGGAAPRPSKKTKVGRADGADAEQLRDKGLKEKKGKKGVEKKDKTPTEEKEEGKEEKTPTQEKEQAKMEKKAKKEKKEKRDKNRTKDDKKSSKAEAQEPVQEPVAETAANGDAGVDEAQRKADKKLGKEQKKKEKKKEKKKLNEAQPEPQGVEMADAAPNAAEAPAAGNKSAKAKAKKEKARDGPATSGAYVQTMSLSGVPQADIDAFMAEHHVAVTDARGGAPLRPVTDFHHLPATNLLEKTPSPFAGFKAPTPIQAASWPWTLSGRDVVGVAETGSGKTMAFALPCVEAVSALGTAGTKAVVVSPTRELAMQTHEQLAALAALAKLKCVCLYGGASKDEQRALLARACDVIVATPGRLKDFMSDGTVDLSAAAFVVLDEADRMLDKGFEEDIKQILGACPTRERRQTLMFTATWPQSVQALASTFMVDPVKVTIGSGGKETENGAVELQANARITQRVEVLEPHDKEARLLQLLKQRQQGKARNDRILVFCLYKKEATRVEGFLSRKGIRVGGIHGDLKQEQRTRSLEAFKTGQTPVLVATDVAARGLDIPDVKLVINVTFPLTIEDYVHRIGRTGRAGNTGEAITFFTTQDKAHSGSLVNILKGANQPVPDELLKFGTTVKKKTHDMYGSFFKDVDMSQKATKITFE